jgi:hypothetical protein
MNNVMKNYLYHFEFFSGFYESYFYQQTRADDEKDAIIMIVSIFHNATEEDTKTYLDEELGDDWTVQKFWDEVDLKFSSDSEGYTLLWIKEINFDLDTVGNTV